MSKIIEIEGNKFDIDDYKQGFQFLNFIFNNEEYYAIVTNSLLLDFLDTNRKKYAQKFNDNNSNYLYAFMEVRDVFEPFFKNLNNDNIFHHYLIENPISDIVKKQQVSHFLEGLMKIIDYYESYEIGPLNFYLKNKTINEELQKKRNLAYLIPSLVIYQEFKNVYDILWKKYDLFIDKDKFSFLFFYSNLEPTEKKEVKELQNEGIENFIINVSDKTEFLKKLGANFKNQKGRTFKILIELLKENEVLAIGSMEFKKFYKAIKPHFEQNIGSYQSINDKYNHEQDAIYYKGDVDIISKKLIPIIEEYKSSC
jgi:hypothetical protein